MELRLRSRPSSQPPPDHTASTSTQTSSLPQSQDLATPQASVNLRSLFLSLLAFRIANALLTRTFFQPDEHYQTTEIAHRIVFGYGFRSWEWSGGQDPAASSSSYVRAAIDNLLDGPVRSILHPMLFVPGYTILRLSGLDKTYLLVLFPRLQQAVIAATGDYYTFRLADRIGGHKVAWMATLVGLTNLYSLYTATRTFSNSTEAAITAAALFYWPFVPFLSFRFDVFSFSSAQERSKLLDLQGPGCEWRQMFPRATKEERRKQPWDIQSQYDRDLDIKQVSRIIYDRALKKSLLLAALACLLRPTNGLLWVFLVTELFVRQLQCLRPKRAGGQGERDARAEDQEGSVLPMLEIVGEAATLFRTVATVGFSSLGLALMFDTVYDCLANQHGPGLILPALSLVSFLHKNVVANLSIFYGANPWHWYISQGVPVLCTIWLPATLFGLVNALQPGEVGVGAGARRSLARLVCVTVGLYSLLGHKEFRFLQPLLPALTILAAAGLATSYGSNRPASTQTQGSPLRQVLRSFNLLPIWLRLILVTVQPMAAIYLNTMHAVAQEQVPFELGRIHRQQQLNFTGADDGEFGPGFHQIHNFGFLMPCHSTPWATHLHDEKLVERSWFIQCPPPPSRSSMSLEQKKTPYWDQSDFFYHDPIKYLVDRFPYNVDTNYPPAPEPGWEREAENVWDQGWRHSWPSHLVVFESLLKEGTRKMGHTRTLKNLLSLKGYREVGRYWNTPKHEDPRRDGDIVVLAYKGPKTRPA